MWFQIMTNIIISVSAILLWHFLWQHLKDNYFTKKTHIKTKQQEQKYKEIINQLQTSKSPQTPEYISPEEKQLMIDDLKSLLIEAPFPSSDMLD